MSPSLIFFLSLVKGLSILLIFFKEQILVSLIPCVFLISILFISCSLYYFLPLGLVCFSFSSSLNRFLPPPFFFETSLFNVGVTAINFPFSTAFAASHKFWYVLFLFLFSQNVFNFPYDFYFDILVV